VPNIAIFCVFSDNPGKYSDRLDKMYVVFVKMIWKFARSRLYLSWIVSDFIFYLLAWTYLNIFDHEKGWIPI